MKATTTTTAPVIKTNAPVIKTNAPVIKTNAPVIRTNAPTTKKPRTTTTTTEEPTVHPDEVKLQNSIDNCIDIYETSKCQALMNSGMSCEKDHLEMFCERSCGFCGKIFNDLCFFTNSFDMCGLRKKQATAMLVKGVLYFAL